MNYTLAIVFRTSVLKRPNLHNFQRAFDQVEADFKLSCLFAFETELCWNFLILFFKVVYQKGFFGEIKKNANFFYLAPDCR